MAIAAFPPVESANEFGLLAIGGDLEVESLLLAYRSGIFPWPVLVEGVLAWFAPPERAVLFFDNFYPSRSLLKKQRSGRFHCTIDQAFAQVIHGCRTARRPGQRGTWITDEMEDAYIRLHAAGYAHSVECWHGKELVGGLYGVSIGGMFAGESMFHRAADASKVALLFLVERLRAHGVTWIDCQQLTPLFERLGAVEIPRTHFMTLLADALKRDKPVL